MSEANTIGLIVTIAIFLAGIVANSYFDRKKRQQQIYDQEEKQKKSRSRYLVALKEEITLNANWLAKSISVFPAIEGIDKFLKTDKKNRVALTFICYTVVFSNRTEVLQDLDEKLINSIIDFYGKLLELEKDVAIIESKAFETISDESRRKVFELILEEQKLAKLHGEDLSKLITVVLAQKN